MLVLSFPNEVPSASRTLGVAPIAYLLVATGLIWLCRALRPFRPLDLLVTLALSGAILGLNVHRYFDVYVAGLPDGNIPFGRVIADYVDRLPAKTTVYMVGCCWGSSSQPEPTSVRYVIQRPAMLHIIDPRDATCRLFESVPRPVVVIWRPELPVPSHTLQPCASIFNSALHSVGDVPVFRSATLGPIP
jgi:hypothetical protein